MHSKIISDLSKGLSNPEILQSPNSATLICKLPAIGEKAFLHVVFSGNDLADITRIEDEEGLCIPHAVKDFLKVVNGMIMYQGSLSLYGIRKSFQRSSTVREPFDFRERNIDRRPLDAKSSQFFVGSYNWDGSVIYVDGEDERVFRRASDNPEILNSWASIWDMLDQEIMRIGRLFDEHGNEINSKVPTTPEPKVCNNGVRDEWHLLSPK